MQKWLFTPQSYYCQANVAPSRLSGPVLMRRDDVKKIGVNPDF